MAREFYERKKIIKNIFGITDKTKKYFRGIKSHFLIFKIPSQLKLYGEKIINTETLEKAFLIFHVLNIVLQEQYREKGGFKKYVELIFLCSCGRTK